MQHDDVTRLAAPNKSGGLDSHHTLVIALVCYVQEQHTLDLWQQKFGFKRISPKQLKQLQSSLPAIGCYQEAVLLSKALASKQQQSASQQGSVKQLQLPIKQLHVQEQQDSKQHQQSSQSATSGR